jgi:hypothetical protein
MRKKRKELKRLMFFLTKLRINSVVESDNDERSESVSRLSEELVE